VEHLQLTMRTIARFHARWWGKDNTSSPLRFFAHPDNVGGPLPFLPKCVPHTGWALLFKNGLKALPHCYSEEGPCNGARKFGEEYAVFVSKIRPLVRRRRRAIVRELFRHPLTVCHGDAHLENIFFGEQYPGGCALIDFGLTMFGQALSDVATVLGGGMSVEGRRAHEKHLVKYYHDCLCDFGVKNYPYEQCWRDYVFQMILPFMRLLTMTPGLAKDRKKRQNMFAETLTEANQKLTSMYVQLNTRYATALLDLEWPVRVEELKKTANPIWRPLS